MKKNSIIFLNLVLFLMIFSSMLALLTLLLLKNSNLVLYRAVLTIIFILSVLFFGYILINGILIVFLLKGKRIPFFSDKWLKSSLNFLYSSILYLSKLFRLDKDKVRNVFTQLNNQIVRSGRKTMKPEDILILLPHCLQNTDCPYKITGNIDNCKRCGLCPIDHLLDIRDQYHTKMFVATGGTLARRIVHQVKPKMVIAVACERDLSSGILDIKKIPVVGILNERPNGPCMNTRVSVKDIEETIQFFIQEGE